MKQIFEIEFEEGRIINMIEKMSLEVWSEEEIIKLRDVLIELTKTKDKFHSFHSMHEGFAVLKEEMDELWVEVKAISYEKAKKEAIQVAAMAIRFIIDCEKNLLGLRKENGL